MSDDLSPYNGTIAGEVSAGTNNPLKEYFRLPLKQKNEIVVAVKASNDASILLFDGSKSSNASDIKVEIVLGKDKNSNVSVGLAKDDGSGKYPSQLIEKDKILSATHQKVFTIRWSNGRVMVYNDGFKKPFVTWDGPKEASFSHIGIRTNGCSGEWVVQGMAVVNTADGAEYHEIAINSGRLDFEVRGRTYASIVLVPGAKWETTDIIHFCTSVDIGGGVRGHGIWWHWVLCSSNPATTPASNLSEVEYKRFWIKWDAHNIWFGVPGSDAVTAYNTPTVPLPQLNYFCAHVCISPFAYFHILDEVRPEDVGSGSGGTSQPAGSPDEEGVLVYNVSYSTRD